MANEGQRRLILTEDDYDSKLSTIVARDYFPDISRLEKKNDLLDQRLKGDALGAVEVRRASRRMIDEEERAAARRELGDRDLVEFDHANGTAITVRKDQKSSGKLMIRKRPRPLEEETLTGFVARATNEDDEEFDSNLKRDIRESRERLEDLHGGNTGNGNNKRIDSLNDPSLEMASDDFAPESNRIEWKKPAARNGLFFNPTPMTNSSTDETTTTNEQQRLLGDGRSVSVPSKELALMPPPSKRQTSNMLSLRTDKQKNNELALKSQLVQYIPKHALEKKIEPRATRFPSKDISFQMIAKSSKGILHDDTDSDSATDYMSTTTDASTDLDAPLRPVEEERRRRKRKKELEQWSYVAMTPQVIPGTGGESPITTWGCIDGTPLVLSGQEEESEPTVSSTFRVSSASDRETAARKAEKQIALRVKLASSSRSSSKSRKKRTIVGTQRPGSLTPAALSLLENTKSVQAPSRDTFGSSLRASYTPQARHDTVSSSSSRSRGRSSLHRKKDHAYNATPQR